MFLWGGVHPDMRKRGIGRELLRWQTEQAHEGLAEQDAASGEVPVPWRIAVSHLEKLADRSRLCEAAGFTAIRWFYDMVRPLSGPEAAPVPELPVPTGWSWLLAERPRRGGAARAQRGVRRALGLPAARPGVVAALDHRAPHASGATGAALVLDRQPATRRVGPEVAAYIVSHAYTQDWEAQGYTPGLDRPARCATRVARAPARPGAARAPRCAPTPPTASRLPASTSTPATPRGALNLYTGMGFRVEHTSVAWAIESPGATGV